MKIAFFDTKTYDRKWFDRLSDEFGAEIIYYEGRLNRHTAKLASGCDTVCPFVNDTLDRETVDELCEIGVRLIALRCAGYNNVDFDAVRGRIPVVRVPAYSPHAVAEHAMALLLTLNRKTHKAYIRTRDFNFSLENLTGFDLKGRTAGIIGTGRIGRAYIDICKGFGMDVLAYDPHPVENADWEYTDVATLCRRSDIISLHCPLTEATEHIIDAGTIAAMKETAIIINTSRGGLVDSDALLSALSERRIGGACLDVYEEESDFFFRDMSDKVMRDRTLALLLSMPNVIVSSHQAFLTDDALEEIARVTLSNIRDFERGKELVNQVRPMK